MKFSNKSFLAIIENWFFKPSSMTGMVAARIVFGLLLFSFYLFRLPFAADIFGPNGIAGANFYQHFPQAIFGVGLNGNSAPDSYLFFVNLKNFATISDENLFTLIYFLVLISALSFACGLFTRTSGTILLITHSFLQVRNPYAYAQWASILKAFIFYITLSNAGDFFSLDARLSKNKKNHLSQQWTGIAWPKRLLQIHICLVYIVASWTRSNQIGWLNGEMLHVMLVNQQFARFNIDWRPFASILKSLCYMGWFIEAVAPVALWIPRVASWTVLSLVSLHLCIELLTHVGGWSFMMIGALMVFVSKKHFEVLNIRPFLAKRAPNCQRFATILKNFFHAIL